MGRGPKRGLGTDKGHQGDMQREVGGVGRRGQRFLPLGVTLPRPTLEGVAWLNKE